MWLLPSHQLFDSKFDDHLRTWRQAFVEVTSDACSLSNISVPVICAMVTSAIALGLVGKHVRASVDDKSESARCMILLPHFVGMVGATITIVDSFRLAQAANMAPGESGQLVGLYWLGAATGFLSMWAILCQRPTIWLERGRLISSCGLLLGITGCLLYLYTAHLVDSGTFSHSTKVLLMMSRAIGGLGQGFVTQLMVVTVVSLTASADMGNQMTRVFFINTLGIGCGPVFSSIAHNLAMCPSGSFSFLLAPTVQMIFLFSALLGVLFMYPDIRDVEVPGQTANQTLPGTEEPVAAFNRQTALVICGIGSFWLRCFVTSGVEVGSALLLEREFGMERTTIGLLIGATFLCSIPMRYAHTWAKDHGLPSVASQFRAFAGLALIGTLLLFRCASIALPRGVAIIIADAIIFPSAFLADGLVYGTVMKNVFPTGSWLDKNYTAMYCNVGGMVARFFAMSVTRFILESFGRSGQDVYAAGQLLACLLMFTIFESGVRPGIKE